MSGRRWKWRDEKTLFLRKENRVSFCKDHFALSSSRKIKSSGKGPWGSFFRRNLIGDQQRYKGKSFSRFSSWKGAGRKWKAQRDFCGRWPFASARFQFPSSVPRFLRLSDYRIHIQADVHKWNARLNCERCTRIAEGKGLMYPCSSAGCASFSGARTRNKEE